MTRHRIRRVPAFAPVRLRSRGDGWSPGKQAAFLGALAETNSVRAAAARIGMSRESAYRLRRRPDAGSFTAAWDHVVGRETALSRKVTPDELFHRATYGLLKVHMYRGRHVATSRKADNSALRRLIAQLDHSDPGKTRDDAG